MTLRRELVLELTALQSPTDQERGIARYVLEHAAALVDVAPEALAGLMLDPGGVWPKTLDRFLGRDLLAWQSERPPVDHDGVFAYHITSPFEFRALDVQWPHYARSDRVLTVVTVYDLIPLLYPEQYLQAPEQRSRYAARVALIGQADLILTISAATARDVVRELGADARNVVNIGTGVPTYFHPVQNRAVADAEIAAVLPSIRPGFVFYTGGDDFRKNIEGLLTAYGRLPPPLRHEHQLVITCKVTPARRDYYRALAANQGILDDVVFTGQIADLTLRSLYQTAHLFVFPSLYEGFGLPLAEALRCGAPAIAADSSSMREIVSEPQHRFDPVDPLAMGRALSRGLVDQAHRRELTDYAASRRDDFLWEHVAERSITAIDAALEVHRRRRSMAGRSAHETLPRIALVTPFPPQASGVADYSAALLPELCRRADVDVFVGPAAAMTGLPLPQNARVLRAESLPFQHSLQPYDGVLYCMGNSEYHVQIHELLQRLPGIVLAHDVRLAGFYAYVAARYGLTEGSFADLARKLQPNIPEAVTAKGYVTQVEQHQHGVFLTGLVVRRALRFLVHSHYAAEVAALQAPECRENVTVVPFGMTRRGLPAATPAPGLRVGTFGMAHPVKRIDLVVQAFALLARERPGARLLVVGDIEAAHRETLTALAEQLGVAAEVEFTARVDKQEYLELIASVHCAVQLRGISNGETSAAVADCLSLGVPTIVSALGSALEYPDDVVLRLSAEAGPDELSSALLTIIDDEALRQRLQQQAIRYVEQHSFRRAADELLAHLLAERRPSLAAAS